LDTIPIYVGSSREDKGQQAAYDVASELRHRLALQTRVRMIFAAAPSQFPMLDALVREDGIFGVECRPFTWTNTLGWTMMHHNVSACGCAGHYSTGYPSGKFISSPRETIRCAQRALMRSSYVNLLSI
jgi:hypothetical protein